MMYYRRKLLLALIEVFHGNLNNTDCEKLLFNFCKSTGKNHYDFFPHRFGPFSFVSYYDKRRLTELGLLKQTQDFQLNTKYSYFDELQPSDKDALLALKASGLRGNPLVKKTYIENPQFTVRSEILEQIFDSEEIKQFQYARRIDKTPVVFTIGYEGLTIDAFLNKLISHNIAIIVDVRNNPQSMKYGFSKKSFSNYIDRVGMEYFHIPELGIPSKMRKELGKSVSQKQLFNEYETNILPHQEEAKQQLINLIIEHQRAALVCFEADSHLCHRRTLIEHLEKERLLTKPVMHI